MAKMQAIEKVVRKHFVTINGKDVEVKQSSTVEQYGKDVVVYENKLAKGKKAGTSEYWVAVADHIPAKKSRGDVVEAMLAQGLTAEEIVAKLRKKQ